MEIVGRNRRSQESGSYCGVFLFAVLEIGWPMQSLMIVRI